MQIVIKKRPVCYPASMPLGEGLITKKKLKEWLLINKTDN